MPVAVQPSILQDQPVKTPRQPNKHLPPQMPPKVCIAIGLPKKPVSAANERMVGRRLSGDYNSNPVHGYAAPVVQLQQQPLFRVPSAGGMRKPLGNARQNYF
jgi:hypothetical protein